MELLINVSLVASFLAGVAALFAPCCISVLLPTYLASIFKQKTLIFFMTFIYFLGLLVVFLPLGLGASFLSQFFSQYHNTIFSLGGVFLIFLGLILLSGRHLALPLAVHPQLKNYDFTSIFVLGVFSGIATTCCAPVLAGVLTLSLLPGSVVLGGIYTLSYVLGMVAPLFVLALVIDKTGLTQKFFLFRKTVSYSFLGQKISLPFSNFFSGLIFLIFGLIVLYLSQTNQLVSHSSYQLSVNLYLAKLTRFVEGLTKLLPEFVWAFILVGLLLIIIKLAITDTLNFLKRDKIRKGVKS